MAKITKDDVLDYLENSNMLEMLSLLTRTNDKKGNYFFLDYSALETQHLGHVYEQLLAYHLKTEKNVYGQ